MDKSWIDIDARETKAYMQGVNGFLAFAFTNSAIGGKIRCPCRKCVNSFWRGASEVREHLICDGFHKGYRTWNLHGEASSSCVNDDNSDVPDFIEQPSEDDEISELIRDLACGLDDRGDLEDDGSFEPDDDIAAIHNLAVENNQELYPGCKYSKLRFLVRLLHIKLLGGWTDRSFDLLIDLLADALPMGSALPRNYHEAKKLVKSVGVGYTTIHACENNCILFWKEHEKSDSCPTCNLSRWKSNKKSLDGKREYKVPRKVLRYFPIKKRLQRLFVCSKTAKLTRWHDEGRIKDGLLRHPADTPLWKDFNEKHPEFAADSRNIRLAFATDGFNPFRTMNVSYSIWPGILIPFNFPPSMCMKDSNFIMSVLIPGRSSAGSDMDVYWQPLVYDLLDMFVNGVRTYDASKGEYFLLRAAILCTITDYPALGSVSGFVTSGEAACPDCHSLICSLRLGNGSKSCYMGHRRFLPPDHPFRFDVDSFGGETELRPAPVPLTGDEILEYTNNIETIYGKKSSNNSRKNRRRKADEPLVFLKRKPIWFILPYWKDLIMRYNFDAMHIEKNVCDNIINTLLDISGKSKDNLNARLDLQALRIRSDLHPVELEDNQFYLPPAPYSMSPAEKKLFCQVLKGVKFPDGYAADIRHNVLVSEKKIVGLNSHANHILLQDLLPLAVRRVLPREVSAVLIRLSNFFKKLYSPIIRISDMQRLQTEIAEILSLLETIFPPSFFTINVHLMAHLPAQARMAGPVHFRSMWSVERFLKKCKGYVRTKSHPEGSIMEGSMFDEALTFCSRYLQDETNFSQRVRNLGRQQTEVSVTTPFFENIGRALAGKCIVNLDHKTWIQAHRYVLFNYANIEPFLNKHALYLSSIGIQNNREINRMHHETFHEWFRLHVEEMGDEASEEIKILAKGPITIAHKYNSYTVNGFNFHTQAYDENRSVQSSGVALAAETTHFERGNDDNRIVGEKIYYGIIKEILELNYHHEGNVVLFKCDWVDNRVQNKWVKTDQFGITTVNFNHLFNTGDKISDEPFILASQAAQVFYVADPIDTEWVAVVQPKPRDLYESDDVDNEILGDSSNVLVTVPDLNPNISVPSFAGQVPCARTDIDGIIVSGVKHGNRTRKKKNVKRKRNQ